jgi:hypothetical protein
MLHEVASQEDFLGEIGSILKPGGQILIVEPLFHFSRSAFETMIAKTQNIWHRGKVPADVFIKGRKSMQNNSYDVLYKKTIGLTVSSLDNEAVAVESLWQDQRVVLVFLRHFGSIFASQQVADLMKVKPELDKMNGGLWQSASAPRTRPGPL